MDPDPRLRHPLALAPARIAAIEILTAQGWSSRQIGEALGITRVTGARYMADLPRPLCPCGRPVSHGGWCRERIAGSPTQQAYFATTRGPGATDERIALIREVWGSTQPQDWIVAAVNALPGPPLSYGRIRELAKRRGLRSGGHPRHAPGGALAASVRAGTALSACLRAPPAMLAARAEAETAIRARLGVPAGLRKPATRTFSMAAMRLPPPELGARLAAARATRLSSISEEGAVPLTTMLRRTG
jgi:hypothetical protein